MKNREGKYAQPSYSSWNSHETEEAMGKNTKGTCVSQPDETTGIEKQSCWFSSALTVHGKINLCNMQLHLPCWDSEISTENISRKKKKKGSDHSISSYVESPNNVEVCIFNWWMYVAEKFLASGMFETSRISADMFCLSARYLYTCIRNGTVILIIDTTSKMKLLFLPHRSALHFSSSNFLMHFLR